MIMGVRTPRLAGRPRYARRRALFRDSGARHIVEHYQRAEPSSWPKQTVVIIDEYAQLVSASGQSRAALEGLVQQYAQFARAFGIYLGRFQRWNSWDVVRDPLGLFSDVAHMVLHPFAHAHVVAFSAVLAAFLLTAYLVVQSLAYHPPRNG